MFRPQEQTRPSAYTFEREGISFRVVLFRLHNSASGAPNIKSAKHWIANPCDTYKRVHHFIIKYDVFMDGTKYNVYHWEFKGLEESF